MSAEFLNVKDLNAVSPVALSSYARYLGWIKSEQYGDHSDVYTSEEFPEIIIPRTQNLADYPSVVFRLMEMISSASEIDIPSLYREIVTADRDVLRLRVGDSSSDGSLPVNSGIDLVNGAKEMILSAACSLEDRRAFYRIGANQGAAKYLEQVRLGQTEKGSFVVTILSPIIAPRLQQSLIDGHESDDDSVGRGMTKHIHSILMTIRDSIEKSNSGDDKAFSRTFEQGVSANICDAIVKMIEPFQSLETSLAWAHTRPIEKMKSVFRFSSSDIPILQGASASFKHLEPRHDEEIFGHIPKLQRDKNDEEGAITMIALIDGKSQSVKVDLNRSDYERAIEAHKARAPIIMRGDLERISQRWRLLNPRIEDVIKGGDDQEEVD